MQAGAHQETEIACELQKTRSSLTLHLHLRENMDISNILTSGQRLFTDLLRSRKKDYAEVLLKF